VHGELAPCLCNAAACTLKLEPPDPRQTIEHCTAALALARPAAPPKLASKARFRRAKARSALGELKRARADLRAVLRGAAAATGGAGQTGGGVFKAGDKAVEHELAVVERRLKARRSRRKRVYRAMANPKGALYDDMPDVDAGGGGAWGDLWADVKKVFALLYVYTGLRFLVGLVRRFADAWGDEDAGLSFNDAQYDDGALFEEEETTEELSGTEDGGGDKEPLLDNKKGK